MQATWPKAVARRIGMGGVVDYTLAPRVGITLHVPCAKGNHVVDVKVKPGIAPDSVVKHMLNHGWTCGSNPVCPDHSRKGRKPAAAVTPEPQPPVQEEAPAMATAPDLKPQPTDAAKRATRMIYQALEDYYDEHSKDYRPGNSDDTIAKETGASVEFVRKIHEEYFGPIGIPPELQTLIDHAASLRSEMTQAFASYQTRLDSFQTRIATLCRAQGWPMPTI